MLKDINPGLASSNSTFIPQSENFYLIAESPNVGRELWQSDGTTDGTQFLSDSNLSGDLISYWNAKIGDEVFIAANTGEKGYELYKIVDNKLELVKDINPGMASGVTYLPPIVHNNILYFVANDGVNGFDVWTSDGTETKIIQNFETSIGPLPQIKLIKVIDDKLYFIQNVKDIGYELFAIDTKKLTKSHDLLNPKTFPIYPNPVSDFLNSDQFINAKFIKITNVLDNIELRSSGNINSIDISNLKSGIYNIEVEFLDKSRGISRFVKI
jgi:ELWxxDGT repeat protein